MVWLLDIAGLEPPSSPLASIHSLQDQIAQSMQSVARRAMEEADHLIFVHAADDAQPPPKLPRQADVVVWNKADLRTSVRPASYLAVSTLTGDGMSAFRDRLDEVAFGLTSLDGTHRLALNARHLDAIDRARVALDRAATIADGPPELSAAELRDAIDAIGTIIGRLTPDDLLGRVFARFCIGK